MQCFTTKIGETRELTQQGFLLCRNVPIARTGTQLYAPGEVPVEPGPDGIIRIDRDADVVFHADTLKSLSAAPIAIDHPEEDVDPSNWRSLAVGITLDPRRGTGIEDDLLIADLLIMAAEGIQAINDGIDEVSIGYDAGYQQTGPGRGRQTYIIANHIALVKNARCGSVCSIGDSASSVVLPNDTRSGDQPVKKNKFLDAFRHAFNRSLDEASEEMEKEDEPKDEAKDSDPEPDDKKDETKDDNGIEEDILKRIEALEAAVEALAKTKDEASPETEGEDDEDDEDEEPTGDKKSKDKKRKSHDSSALANEIQDVFARVEILAPGMALPTFDAKSDAAKTKDSLCSLRRKALAKAYDSESGRDAIKPFLKSSLNKGDGDTPNFKTLDCARMEAAFIGASEILKRSNSSVSFTSDSRTPNQKAADSANLIASINKANAEFWARK